MGHGPVNLVKPLSGAACNPSCAADSQQHLHKKHNTTHQLASVTPGQLPHSSERPWGCADLGKVTRPPPPRAPSHNAECLALFRILSPRSPSLRQALAIHPSSCQCCCCTGHTSNDPPNSFTPAEQGDSPCSSQASPTRPHSCCACACSSTPV